ncbi:MAG: outer membrane beta-barrel protein [Pseudomonadota bacterium]|nr:outer membrane beta-barrel protein [Pseudomonadota bacterium]
MKQWNKAVLIAMTAATLSSANATLDKGWYIAANLGSTDVEIGVSNLTGTARLDESSFGGKLLMGYEFKPYLAMEGFIASLGTATIEGTTGDTFQYQNTTYVFGSFGEAEFSTGSIGVAAKLMLPLGDSFRFYGKAGVQAWALTNNTTAIDDETGGGTYLGGGMSVDLTDTLTLSIDYDEYELEETASMTSLGLQYNF